MYQVFNRVPKQQLWVSEVLPNLDEDRFKAMMRCDRSQFNLILTLIENNPVFNDRRGKMFPTAVQLAILLYRIGSYGQGVSVQNIAALFGIGDGSSVTRITRRVQEVKLVIILSCTLLPKLN